MAGVGGAYLVLRKPPEAYTLSFMDAEGTPIPGSIAGIETVNPGGFEQTITIRGLNSSNPVLPHLHGRYDYACPGVLVEEYSQSLAAHEKSFTWFENSAHDVVYEESELFSQSVNQIAEDFLAANNQ